MAPQGDGLGKKVAKKKAASKKPTTKKSAAKKSPRPSKAASKASPKTKPAAKKVTSKKSTTKKAASKKPTAKKPATKKATAKKAASKKAASPAPAKAAPDRAAPKSVAKKKPASKKKAAAATADSKNAKTDAKTKPSGKTGRKGITIVTPKQSSKAKSAPSRAAVPALTGSILGMGLGSGKPLIPSGPSAAAIGSAETAGADEEGKKPKSPFTKRQLDRYSEILIQKRRELLGDIDSMESEALKSQSGSLSHLPQHMAEQGSETYEQSLSLDLAAADRVLLREIDAALKRIADRTYGLCERTGKPISKERLAELPWARYSIEAAREMERRTTL